MRHLPRAPRRRYAVACITLFSVLALLLALTTTAGATHLRSGVSPKKGLIAFVGSATGVPQLYTVGSDGSQPRQLTFDAPGLWVFGQPTWAPDGKRLVVGVSFRVFATTRADGSDRVDIGGTAPVFSPDGNWLAYTVCASPTDFECDGLYVSHANGRNPILIDAGSQPTWSSDGKSLVYVKATGINRRSIWVSDRRGNKTEVLADRGFVQTPVFFPDDHTITFLDGGLGPQVFFIRIGETTPTMPGGGIVPGESGRLLLSPTRADLVLDGSAQGPRRIALDPDETFTRTRIGGANAFHPVWSPNGAMVAFAYCDRTFTGFPGGPCSIRVSDGTTTTTIYNGPTIESRDWVQGFDWSPDSSSLVLSVASGGEPYRLKIVGADGLGLAQLTPSGTDSQTNPAWQPANH